VTNYLELARDSYEIEAVLDILSYSLIVLNQCHAVVIQIIINSIRSLCIIMQSLLSTHYIHHYQHHNDLYDNDVASNRTDHVAHNSDHHQQQHRHHTDNSSSNSNYNDSDRTYQASKCQHLKNNADRNIQLVYEILHTMSSRISIKIRYQLQYTILLLYPFTSLQLKSQKQLRDNNSKLVTSSAGATTTTITTATTTTTTTTATTTATATIGGSTAGRMNTTFSMSLIEGSRGRRASESVVDQMDFNDVYEQLKKKWGQRSIHRIELTKRYRCFLSLTTSSSITTVAVTATTTTTTNNNNNNNNSNDNNSNNNKNNNNNNINNSTTTVTHQTDTAIFVPNSTNEMSNGDSNRNVINEALQQTMIMTSYIHGDDVDMSNGNDEDSDNKNDDGDIHIEKSNSSHENNQTVDDNYLQSLVHTSSSSSSNLSTALTITTSLKRRKTTIIPRLIDDDLIATTTTNNNNYNNDVKIGVDDKHLQRPSKLARVNLVNSLFSILD